jgi:hypothetical protein
MNKEGNMNTDELAQVMHMAPNFYGVVPCCEIEQFKKHSTVGLIVNTDPHNKPGEHWIGLYKEGEMLNFFDSFGRGIKEFGEPFASIMNDFASDLKLVTNRMQYQDVFYDTCGRWTYYYIFSKICGRVDFKEFTQDTVSNEIELDIQWSLINEMLRIMQV